MKRRVCTLVDSVGSSDGKHESRVRLGNRSRERAILGGEACCTRRTRSLPSSLAYAYTMGGCYLDASIIAAITRSEAPALFKAMMLSVSVRN